MELILPAMLSSCSRPAVCLNLAFGVEKLEIIHLKVEPTDPPMHLVPVHRILKGFGAGL